VGSGNTARVNPTAETLSGQGRGYHQMSKHKSKDLTDSARGAPQEPHKSRAKRAGLGAALLMAAAPFLLLGLLILADRMLQ